MTYQKSSLYDGKNSHSFFSWSLLINNASYSFMASLYAHSQFGSPFEAPIDHKNDMKLPFDIKIAFPEVWCL